MKYRRKTWCKSSMETDACGRLEDITSDDSEERAAGWLSIATATNRDYTQAIISTLNVLCLGLEVLHSLMSDRQHRTEIMAVLDI